jgi:hypothetical protein
VNGLRRSPTAAGVARKCDNQDHQNALDPLLNVLIDTSIWSLALRCKPERLNPAEKRALAPRSIHRQLSDQSDYVRRSSRSEA